MASLLIIGLVGLSLAIVARSLRGTLSDRHSLEDHHKALDTLGDVTHQQVGATPIGDAPGARAHVRIVADGAAPSPPPLQTGRRRRHPSPVIPTPPVARSGSVRPVTTTLAPASPPAPSPAPPAPSPAPAAPSPAPRAPSPAAVSQAPRPPQPAASLVAETRAAPTPGRTAGATRPAHRRRRNRALRSGAILAVAVAVVVLALAGVFSNSGAPRHAGAVPPPPPTTVVVPTTAPAATQPAVLVASDSQGARYSVLAAVDIELVPSLPSWVEIRNGTATGTLVYQGLLRPGSRHPVPSSSPIWLRLGNPPGVAIVVNGTPLQPPAHATSQPYNLTFVRASS